MPIYEYDCAKCKRKTEVIQRMSDPRLKVCPHCGGKLTKAFSAPAIQFKGSGFYITDYARAKQETGGEGSSGKSEKGDSSEGESSKSGSGEKAERADKAQKADKAQTAEKAEKANKAEKSEKSEKGGKKKPAP